MATLATRLADLATRVATQSKLLRTYITGSSTGDLSGLSTTAKGSIIAAINDLQSQFTAFSGDAAGIDDAVIDDDSTWSSEKIVAELEAYKQSIIGGASSAYDTLVELQAFLEGQASDLSSLLTAIGNRVRYDAAQVLDNTQKAQARSNIGAQSAAEIGNTDQDLVAIFEAGLV